METNYERIFGTPEKAARTLRNACDAIVCCADCPMYATGACSGYEGEDGVLEWLKEEGE